MGSGWWGGRGGTGALGSIGALGPGRGRRDDGDVFSRSGAMCSVWGRMCPVFCECVQFLARCVHFPAECVHFGGAGVQFSVKKGRWSEGRAVRQTWMKARFAPSASSGQASACAQGRFFGDAGITGMCPLCQAECVQFLGPMCQLFGRMCPTLAGDVSSFWRCALAGDGGADGRRDSSFGKLRTGFGGLRTGRFGRLAMNARGVGSQGCGPGFDLTGRG